MKKKLTPKQLWVQIKMHNRAIRKNTHPVSYYIGLTLLGIFTAFVMFYLFMNLIVFPLLPSVSSLEDIVPDQSSVILDKEGNELYQIFGEENRKNIPLDEISEFATLAVLAIEDDNFYNHSGIDIGGILKAICAELKVCGQARGGSTITQQFVKNAFLSPERSYTRKAKEILLALKLEQKFSKDEILEFYLNRISYGSNTYGIELAANNFFEKSASELTLAEGAILASIPKAPTYYSPYGGNRYAKIDISDEEIIERGITTEQELADAGLITKGLVGKTYYIGQELDEEGEIIKEGEPLYVKGRTDFILDRMVDLGYISEDEHDDALVEVAEKEFKASRENIVAPHFVFYVREQLEEKYGKDQIERGGLKITTTLDPVLQEHAEAAVAFYAEQNEQRYKATNASLVSVDPNTGHILAMVGSKDFWDDEIDGKVNVALRPRLPGSSFKPIAYAASFLQGYAPSTVVYDVLTKFGSWYEPENFDGEFLGPIDFRNALAQSRNIPAIKAGHLAGIPNVLDLARKMGIQLNQPDDWYGLSLALGAGEARLIDMVYAYGVFASGGYREEPVSILKIEDKDGNILEEYEPPRKKDLILDPQVAYLINDVLSDISARPEGWWRDRLSIPGQINAAKTGTSNKEKNEIKFPFDTWTIGYTRNLVAGVWAGNADGTGLAQKASGLDTAGGIWSYYMTEATKEQEEVPFERPEGIKWLKVSKRSGKLPSENTKEEDIITAPFASFSVPREYDESYQLIEIDTVSGKLATEFTPDEAREEKPFFAHQSILPDNPNWQEGVELWAEENDQASEIPTEYDDVHTAETVNVKPDVTITSPRSLGVVTAPSVGVVVDIKSKVGVSRVDYYWNGELVDTAESAPYKGTIPISKRLKDGSKHKIKAVVFDGLLNSNASTVQVKIGEDKTPPVAEFTYPGNNAKLDAGDLLVAQVDAYDPSGDVARVEFSLDGEPLETDREAPYIVQFQVPEELGEHTLKAVVHDFAGNTKSTTVDFQSKTPSNNFTGVSRILEPRKNISYDQGEPLFVKIYLDDEAQELFESAKITLKKSGEKTEDLFEVEGPSQTATFIWDSPLSGTYDLQLKVNLTNGKTRFSEKIPIVIR